MLFHAAPSHRVAAQGAQSLTLPLIQRGPDLVGGQVFSVHTLANSPDLILVEVNSIGYNPPDVPFAAWFSRDGGRHWQQPATRPWESDPAVYWSHARHTLLGSNGGPLLVTGRPIIPGGGQIDSVLFFSADFGETWKRRLLPDVPGCPALWLALLHTTPAQPERLYVEAGCTDVNGNAVESNVWLATSDAGLTWQVVIAPDQNGFSALLSPAQAERLFVVDDAFVSRLTEDDVSIWTQVGAGPNGLFELTRPDPDRILARSEWGPFLSTDSGATWQAFTQIPCVLTAFFLSEIQGSNPLDVVRCEDGRLLATPDAGETWVTLPTGPWSASANVFADMDHAVLGRLWMTTTGGEGDGLYRLDPGPGQVWVPVLYAVLPRYQ